MPETWVWSLGWEDALEEGMATHTSILAWRIPWTEEPGGLQYVGSQTVGHDWETKHNAVPKVSYSILFQCLSLEETALLLANFFLKNSIYSSPPLPENLSFDPPQPTQAVLVSVKSSWVHNPPIFYYIPKVRGRKELSPLLHHFSPSHFLLLISKWQIQAELRESTPWSFLGSFLSLVSNTSLLIIFLSSPHLPPTSTWI